MRVLELWRYPVKSMQGEQVESVAVTADGFEGDRRYALYDLETGLGLTARRVPELLFASARWHDGGGVEITLPDGSVAGDDEALSAWLGRRVALRSLDAEGDRRFEIPEVDFDEEAERDWHSFEGAPGPFHDSADVRVSLVSTETVGGWDRRRFRSNVLLEGGGEEGLVGSEVTLGDAVLAVGKGITRCVMTVRPQPGGIERDLSVLRTIARERDNRLAVGAIVTRAGRVAVGDVLQRTG